MQKTFRVTAFLCLLFIVSSCTKLDLIRDHLGGGNDHPGLKSDYILAKAPGMLTGEFGADYFPFLFKKIYDSDGKKLKQISTTYRYNASDIFLDDYLTLDVRQSGMQVDFVAPGNDTIASLRLNQHGKPETAWATRWMRSHEERHQFVFFYSAGKLAEIRFSEGGPQKLYAKIEYEQGRKNVKAIYYHYSDLQPLDKVTYTYDYSKRANGQYYPDDNNDLNFWKFLKYLNLFGELQSENILVGSYFKTSGYPGDMVRVINQHQFDDKGRVTGYNLAENYVEHGTPEPGSGFDWIIQWK